MDTFKSSESSLNSKQTIFIWLDVRLLQMLSKQIPNLDVGGLFGLCEGVYLSN